MKDNIIVFPKNKKGAPPNNLDEIRNSIDVERKKHIEFLVNEIVISLVAKIFTEGFNIADPKCKYTVTLMIDALRATLYKSIDLDHNLQEYAQEIYADQLAETDQVLQVFLDEFFEN